MIVIAVKMLFFDKNLLPRRSILIQASGRELN